ncbi:DgyrCDS1961 [Dimorphilus gyrociliatus]|uniref:DgyrCDS1961 n=1 Tax=Dimorphilus gyrociliatus TaxID=2664684 RepID=A0A7I8V8V7_9ANNE|nr:DgyrCDS1961 [Dimorphilus gyrociliatus]
MGWLTTEEDHHHEEEEDGQINRISTWNIVLCYIVLILVFLFGSFFSTINIFGIKNKLSQLGNIIILVAMIYVGIANLDYVTENFCYVQEQLTYIIVQNGLIFPALLAGDRLDLVYNPHKRILNAMTITFLVIIGVGISLVITVIPVLGVKSGSGPVHQHGCHLWSKR